MAKRVSVINMKGGVGKSTLSVNMAWHFSAMINWSKNVLLVDLDPQFNASQYMLGVNRYLNHVQKLNKPTVWDIFEQHTRAPGLKAAGRSLRDSIVNVATFTTGSRLDLVPSQLELSLTLRNPGQKEHLLASFIDDVESSYDLVIIDCAPTDSVLTTAAYLASNFILIPVKPEFLSTIGLPLIQQSLNDFQKLYRKNLSVAGLCFNCNSEYYPEEARSKAEVANTARSFGWHLFREEIPFSRSFPKGAREGQPIFRTTYSRSSVATKVSEFCNAFAGRVAL